MHEIDGSLLEHKNVVEITFLAQTLVSLETVTMKVGIFCLTSINLHVASWFWRGGGGGGGLSTSKKS